HFFLQLRIGSRPNNLYPKRHYSLQQPHYSQSEGYPFIISDHSTYLLKIRVLKFPMHSERCQKRTCLSLTASFSNNRPPSALLHIISLSCLNSYSRRWSGPLLNRGPLRYE